MPLYKMHGKKRGFQKYLVRVNYTDDAGKCKQCSRVAYGLDSAKDLESRLLRKKFQKDIKPHYTLAEVQKEYILSEKFEIRESTLEKKKEIYRFHIAPFLGNVRLDRLSTKVLQNWKLQIESGNFAIATKKNIYTELRAILNYAVRMGYLPRNPLLRVGNFKSTLIVRKKMQYYTAEEFRRFIRAARDSAEKVEHCRNDVSEWNYYVFFCIAFYAGLRKGEIFALKWTDIKENYLTVSRSINQKLRGEDRETAPKNASSVRTLQIPRPLMDVLNAHKERQKRLSGYNEDFRICGGVRPIRDTSVQKKNIEYATKAGIKTIRIHDFRHSNASLLANAGVNIQEIARRLGHSNIEMTWGTYSHLYPKAEDKAVAVLNKVII